MTARSRRFQATHPRQAAIYALRKVYGRRMSFPMIGKQFGLDHSTCIHAVDAVERRASADPEFAQRLEALVKEVECIKMGTERKLRERRISDAQGLPLRITASQVCDLAGYGPATLTKRIREGAMPAPVDRAYERIFDRDAVLRALDLLPAAQQAGSASW